jgi:hypothetical protein
VANGYTFIQKTGYIDPDKSERRIGLRRFVDKRLNLTFEYTNDQGTTMGGMGLILSQKEALELATALTFYAEGLDLDVR